MAFNFEDDGVTLGSDTPNYEYNPVKYTSQLELPEVVYSDTILEEWMAFISDCHIPVTITLYEGNDDLKRIWRDKPEVSHPLILIDSEILEFEGCRELISLGFPIGGGGSCDGYYQREIFISDFVDAVTCKAGRIPLNSDNEIDEMTTLLAKSSTSKYHRQKGYLDAIERPLLMADQLGELFGRSTEDITKIIFTGSNVLMESDDCFIFVKSGGCTDVEIIDPQLIQSPTYPPFLYVLCRDDERFEKESRIRELTSTMLDRLGSKPVLIFQTENKVVRGHHVFLASDIYKASSPSHEVPRAAILLRFHGIYHYAETDKFGRKVITRNFIGKTKNICAKRG